MANPPASLLQATIGTAYRINPSIVFEVFVHKVDSFTRTLVGVRDLADQFGGVYFDSEYVYVVSKTGDEIIWTELGKATETRLYSFDLEALEKHVESCEASGQPVELGQAIEAK